MRMCGGQFTCCMLTQVTLCSIITIAFFYTKFSFCSCESARNSTSAHARASSFRTISVNSSRASCFASSSCEYRIKASSVVTVPGVPASSTCASGARPTSMPSSNSALTCAGQGTPSQRLWRTDCCVYIEGRAPELSNVTARDYMRSEARHPANIGGVSVSAARGY